MLILFVIISIALSLLFEMQNNKNGQAKSGGGLVSLAVNQFRDELESRDVLDRIGQDTEIYVAKNKILIVNVHFSNDPLQLTSQVQALEILIKKYSDFVVIVTGDFNAFCLTSGSEMELAFHSRDSEVKSPSFDNATVIMNFQNRKIVLGNNSIPTTCKMRVITTQIKKMLQLACFCADWCFAVFPSGLSGSVDSEVIEFDNIVTEQRVCSLNWCSDHFALRSTVKLANRTVVIGSLNALGESISGKAYNIFEFVSAEALSKMQTNASIREEFLNLIKNEKNKSLKISSGQISVAEAITKKYLSKTLRAVNLMNVHLPTFSDEFQSDPFTQELRNAYDEEMKKVSEMEPSDIPILSNYMIGFFNSLYSNPILEPWFKSWYREVINTKKSTIEEVLLEYLRSGIFDVFCLQEVSNTMYTRLLEMTEISKCGYRLIAPKTMRTKTVGVLLVRI